MKPTEQPNFDQKSAPSTSREKLQRRRAVAFSAILISSGLGIWKGVELVSYPFQPHEVGSTIMVTGGENTGRDICEAMEPMVLENGGSPDINACFADMDGFKLPEGTPVKIGYHETPVVVTGDGEANLSIGFGVGRIETSVDGLIEEYRAGKG